LGGPIDRAAFERRIEFHPWFFYVEDVAYIEHGHQYDAFCATDHVRRPSRLPTRAASPGVSPTCS